MTSATDPSPKPPLAVPSAPSTPEAADAVAAEMPKEIGGAKGLEPTRYGDWERNGRCTDF